MEKNLEPFWQLLVSWKYQSIYFDTSYPIITFFIHILSKAALRCLGIKRKLNQFIPFCTYCTFWKIFEQRNVLVKTVFIIVFNKTCSILKPPCTSWFDIKLSPIFDFSLFRIITVWPQPIWIKVRTWHKYHHSIKVHIISRRPRISINWNPPFQTSLHKISKEVFFRLKEVFF